MSGSRLTNYQGIYTFRPLTYIFPRRFFLRVITGVVLMIMAVAMVILLATFYQKMVNTMHGNTLHQMTENEQHLIGIIKPDHQYSQQMPAEFLERLSQIDMPELWFNSINLNTASNVTLVGNTTQPSLVSEYILTLEEHSPMPWEYHLDYVNSQDNTIFDYRIEIKRPA